MHEISHESWVGRNGFLFFGSVASLIILGSGIACHEYLHVHMIVPFVMGVAFEVFFVIPMHFIHRMEAGVDELRRDTHSDADRVLLALTTKITDLSERIEQLSEFADLVAKIETHEEILGVTEQKTLLIDELKKLAVGEVRVDTRWSMHDLDWKEVNQL